jgi:diacylglycerol kinase family enzyme
VHAVLICNPNSGKGHARTLLRSVTEALRSRGVSVTHHHADAHQPPHLDPRAPRPDVFIVLGGDGSVFHALPDILALEAPVYHLPVGTENLFAREFGMTRSAQRLADALLHGVTRPIDLGAVDGRPFAVMASFGPDAAVVHRLAARRNGPISHLSYALPALRESLRPALRPVRVEVDGRPVFDHGPALVVVANSRQYGARFDPALGARVDDGLLDVAVLPASTTLRVLVWALACRLRLQRRLPGCVYARGAGVRITGVNGPLPPCQIDGEAVTLQRPDRAQIAILPGALRVLTPAPARPASVPVESRPSPGLAPPALERAPAAEPVTPGR